jgi:hypothetical protein
LEEKDHWSLLILTAYPKCTFKKEHELEGKYYSIAQLQSEFLFPPQIDFPKLQPYSIK